MPDPRKSDFCLHEVSGKVGKKILHQKTLLQCLKDILAKNKACLEVTLLPHYPIDKNIFQVKVGCVNPLPEKAVSCCGREQIARAADSRREEVVLVHVSGDFPVSAGVVGVGVFAVRPADIWMLS